MGSTSSSKQKDVILQKGNCIELMGELDLHSVDMVFADPPFNIGLKYPNYNDKLSSNEYMTFTQKWMNQVYRVLKPGGAFWFAIGDDYAAELTLTAKRTGFELINWVIWHYTFGQHTTQQFTSSHTHLLYFWSPSKKNKRTFHPIRVQSTRQLIGDPRAAEGGKVPDDVWDYPRVCGNYRERVDYVCQMPEDLLTRVLIACSDEGQLVLDPFLGSGTTAVVAKRLRRRFIGFDISPKSLTVTKERLKWQL